MKKPRAFNNAEPFLDNTVAARVFAAHDVSPWTAGIITQNATAAQLVTFE